MNESDFLKGKVSEWFVKASSDLRAIDILLKDYDPPIDSICFHAQQAVEKYIKGLLTFYKIDFIKTHDLDYLLKLAKNVLPDIADYEPEILLLNKYAIEPRYPADVPVYYGLDEAKKAFDNAKSVVNFILSRININNK